MRVTNKMIANRMLYNMTRNLKNVVKFGEYADGKRIHKPSDDPIAVAKALGLRTDISENYQHGVNIRDAISWFEVTEDAIIGINDSFKRLKQLAVQAANGVYSVADVQKINAEVKTITDTIISCGNVNYSGKFVFSGFQSDSMLLNAKTGEYNIDVTNMDMCLPPKIRTYVGKAELIELSTSGLDIFGAVLDENVYRNMFTDTAGSVIEEGVSFVQGEFDLNKNHSKASNDLNVTVDGKEYVVDKAMLNGEKSTLTVDEVLETFKNAVNGTEKLDDVADVYFDEHKNLVIRAKRPGKVVSVKKSTYRVGSLLEGVASKKAFYKGKFALKGKAADYRAANFKVTLKGSTDEIFNIDTSGLTGYGFTLKKADVLKQFRTARNMGGTKQLSDVADIFFDQDNNLIIKEKNYNSDATNRIEFSGGCDGYDPLYNKKEAEIKFTGKKLADADFAALGSETFDITLNGGAPYTIAPAAASDPAGYVANVQAAIDSVGELTGKVKVYLSNGNIAFSTISTSPDDDNKKPTLRVVANGIGEVSKIMSASEIAHGNISQKIEAELKFTGFNLSDSFIFNNIDQLKKTPVFVTLNGSRKKVTLDPDAVISKANPAKDYVQALQRAIDEAHGSKKIEASIEDGTLVLKTINTEDGVKPSLKFEPVVTRMPSLIKDLQDFSKALDTNDKAGIDKFLTNLSGHLDRVLSVRADIGARYNRMKLSQQRNETNNLTFTDTLTQVEGVDMSKAILEFKQYDAVYRASLSISSKVMQPSLIDFLK